jgi:RNase P subunit RPR2
MWNCKKCEVCGTTGSVKYVKLQEVLSMWNWRKCEICGTAGRVNYVELQEV